MSTTLMYSRHTREVWCNGCVLDTEVCLFIGRLVAYRKLYAEIRLGVILSSGEEENILQYYLQVTQEANLSIA